MIPEAAVEAAAKVTFEGLYDNEAWEDVTHADRVPYQDQARASLEAAARFMCEAARDEGYRDGLNEQFRNL